MLISLEGLDGSGKTTAWQTLRDTGGSGPLADVTYTSEPTDSWYGEAVTRSVADQDADPLAELFLYTADHADHLSRVVRPALDQGHAVITDRYVDSRYAYQGATLARGDAFDSADHDPLDYVRSIHEPWTRTPDRTIYLDVDPGVAVGRSAAVNKFEQEDYLAAVRENYERLIDDAPDRFVRIDAEREQDIVLAEVRETIAALLE